MSVVISDFRPICKFEHFNGRAQIANVHKLIHLRYLLTALRVTLVYASHRRRAMVTATTTCCKGKQNNVLLARLVSSRTRNQRFLW